MELSAVVEKAWLFTAAHHQLRGLKIWKIRKKNVKEALREVEGMDLSAVVEKAWLFTVAYQQLRGLKIWKIRKKCKEGL